MLLENDRAIAKLKMRIGKPELNRVLWTVPSGSLHTPRLSAGLSEAGAHESRSRDPKARHGPEGSCADGGNRHASAGFTFVELLAILLTLSLLVSLGVPTLVRAKQRNLHEVCQSNLRQIGLALQEYTEANQEYLPGPLFELVQPAYDPRATNELAWYLAGQLELRAPCDEPALASVLVCPADAQGSEAAEERLQRDSYLLNEAVTIGKVRHVPPFGHPASPTAPPLKLSALAASGSPASVWAVSDADKGNVNPTLAAWKELPYEPVHGDSRNRLYFDWHAGSKTW